MSKHHGSPRGPSSRSPVFRGLGLALLRSRFRSFVALRHLIAVGLTVIAGLSATGAAQAAVEITIDKSNQQMTVAVDGVARYNWPVSTGVPSRETPNGTFRAFRMEADHYSKEWDDAPMPHSIFFTKVGHAIHGTDSVGRLGSPASHGCVRLSRENAATLYALVEEQGVLNTTVTLTGSAQAALSRGTGRTQMARGDGAGDPTQLAPGGDGVQPGSSSGRSNGFFGAGNSVDPDQQNVVYVDRYGRPLDVFVTPDGRRVYRLRRQQPQYNQVDAYGRPYQPRGLFDQ